MARIYTDIAHFRAPYKNWPYLGVGADPDPGTATSSLLPGPTGVFSTDASGIRTLTPSAAVSLINLLAGASAVFIDNDNIKLDTRTTSDPRPSASDWMTAKLAEGKSVVIGAMGGLPSLFAAGQSIPALNIALMAVVGKDGEVKVAGPNTLPVTAVLARSTKPLAPGAAALSAAGMSTAAIALLAVAGIGVAAYMMKRKRSRGAVPNRRRRATRRSR